ncbi:MAG: hypothetical protein AAGI01_17360, partial [Myxococcota bacterium]
KLRFFDVATRGLGSFARRPLGEPRAAIPLALGVATAPGGPVRETVEIDLSLYGPQDVVSLDASRIVRREPTPNTGDFEPNYLPFVEFDMPELPWMFSPDGARPWLCLLVAPKVAGVSVSRPTSASNAVLELDFADPELSGSGWTLPDLSDSAWWAHAQLIEADGSAQSAAAQSMEKEPRLALSRLLCPIRLSPQTGYHACLVPTTAGGVAKGLGESPVSSPLDGAWDHTAVSVLRLPVYDHFEFRTGRAGDFESLAARLKPKDLSGVLSERAVTVSRADLGGPVSEFWETGHRGVLSPPSALPPEAPDEGVAGDLDTLFGTEAAPSGASLGPPVYGQHPAGLDALPEAGVYDGWLRELNLDPRLRAAAGVGRAIVQREQDQLMRSAWAQVGALAEVNAFHARAQLAREGAGVTFSSVSELGESALDAVTALQVLSPLLSRVRGSASSSNPDHERTAASVLEEVDPIAAGLTDRAARRFIAAGSPALTHRSRIVDAPAAWRAITGQLPALAPDPDEPSQRPGMIPPQMYLSGALVPEASPPDRALAAGVLRATQAEILANTSAPQERREAAWAHLESLAREFPRLYDAPYVPDEGSQGVRDLVA